MIDKTHTLMIRPPPTRRLFEMRTPQLRQISIYRVSGSRVTPSVSTECIPHLSLYTLDVDAGDLGSASRPDVNSDSWGDVTQSTVVITGPPKSPVWRH
ncbi:hypothetical protein J6590_023286 [Homalodisca vitripennis]|nr:hypothetical protein J6590_023286 [Homalodisca vitripennis]